MSRAGYGARAKVLVLSRTALAWRPVMAGVRSNDTFHGLETRI